MANKVVTLRPGDPDDLICDTCPERFTFRGSVARTIDAARVAGWHIHPEDRKRLCPTCVGTPRTQAPRVAVMEGQTDVLAELNITWEPVVKRKGRELS